MFIIMFRLSLWETMQAAYNVPRGCCVRGTWIQGPVCPHKINISVFSAFKQLVEHNLKGLFNLSRLHHFRDPPNPDILPSSPIVKVLKVLTRIRCVPLEETIFTKFSTALSRLASALSVWDKRSDRDMRSVYKSVMAEKVFNVSSNLSSESCRGCNQSPLPCLLRPIGSPYCAFPCVPSAPSWLQSSCLSGGFGIEKAPIYCGFLVWRMLGVIWSQELS